VLVEETRQELLGRRVTGVLELAALEALATHLEQQLAGDGGGPGGEAVVVGQDVVGRDGGGSHGFTSEDRRMGWSGAGAQVLNRPWAFSRPSVSRLSTASAARSTWNGSTFRSAAE